MSTSFWGSSDPFLENIAAPFDGPAAFGAFERGKGRRIVPAGGEFDFEASLDLAGLEGVGGPGPLARRNFDHQPGEGLGSFKGPGLEDRGVRPGGLDDPDQVLLLL